MRWLDRVKGWLQPSQQRSLTLADFPQLLLNNPTAAGVTVTETTALNFSAYYNGVDIISSQVASLPRIVYRRGSGDVRERVDTSPLARLMAEPNQDMTDIVFWQTLMAHVLTWGNAYAEIEWDRAMRPIGLWPVSPQFIDPVLYNGRLAYRFQGKTIIAGEDMVHITGLGFDGRRGYSVVQMARQSLGLGMAAERFGGAFFGNGAWPGFLLEHPGRISAEAAVRLQKSWDDLRRGPDRAYQTAVLEEGMKANKLGIPPDDAQFLQTREFQVVEIARWLNLPPHKLKHKVGERPGGNIEASQIEFLTDTLRPWLVRIEQELDRKLIAPAQRTQLYVEHLVDSMLRTDNVSRMLSYKALFEMGVLDAEQIAKKENLPKPKPAPTPEPGQPPIPADTPIKLPSSITRARIESAQRALLIDAVARFTRREAEKVRRAAKRPLADFGAWVEEFCRDERDVLRGHLAGPIRVNLAQREIEADADGVALRLAEAYLERSKEALLSLPARELEVAAERMVAEWLTTRPSQLAEEILSLRADQVTTSTQQPMTINVPVTINVPEQAPPPITVNVPAQLPPAITVNVPKPNVLVEAPVTVNVPAPQVVVKMPPPAAMKVERDPSGNISGLTPKG